MKEIPFRLREMYLFLGKLMPENIEPKVGRKKKHSDALVVLAGILLSLEYSYRVVKESLRRTLEINVHISNIHYRLKKDLKIRERMSEVLLDLVEKEFKKKECRGIVVDGTGFGYNLKVKQRIYWGEKIRGIKLHVKVVVIVGVKRRGRGVLGIFVDDAYSDERKMLGGEEGVFERDKRIGGDIVMEISCMAKGLR